MKNVTSKTIALFIGLSFSLTVQAQVVERVKENAKQKTAGKIEEKADKTVDKALNKLEEGIGGLFKKKKKDETQAQTNEATNAKRPDLKPGETDFSQYKGSTFMPGKNVLFFEDFATARIGAGANNWHIYEYDPSDDFERPKVTTIPSAAGNWLKLPRKGFAFPNSFKNLPEQFTLEYDLYIDPKKMSEMEGGFRTNLIALDSREDYSIHWAAEPSIGIDVHPHGDNETFNVVAMSEYDSSISEKRRLFDNTFKKGWNLGEVNRISIFRNGAHVSLYLNGQQVVSLANGLPKKAQYNLIFSTNLYGDGAYVSNVRVAGNVPNAVNEISTAGKFVTNAIYFDVNSATIKPESWATLNNAAQAIKVASGNILIVGHTDSDGSDVVNLKLSQDRAASVKQVLIRDFGIDASRLITNGKGESEPITSNNTALGKAQNRRVEFIKQ